MVSLLPVDGATGSGLLHESWNGAGCAASIIVRNRLPANDNRLLIANRKKGGDRR